MPPGLGVASRDHFRPVQCSTWVREASPKSKLPTAQQFAAEVQRTLLRLLLSSSAVPPGLGAGTGYHLRPLKCRIWLRVTLFSSALPTAQQSVFETQLTPMSTLSPTIAASCSCPARACAPPAARPATTSATPASTDARRPARRIALIGLPLQVRIRIAAVADGHHRDGGPPRDKPFHRGENGQVDTG